jgi:hypothetical protein
MMSISGSVLGDSKLQRTLSEKVCFARRSKEGSPDLREGLSYNGVWQAACFQDLTLPRTLKRCQLSISLSIEAMSY